MKYFTFNLRQDKKQHKKFLNVYLNIIIFFLLVIMQAVDQQ